jgi:hypothetical protein
VKVPDAFPVHREAGVSRGMSWPRERTQHASGWSVSLSLGSSRRPMRTNRFARGTSTACERLQHSRAPVRRKGPRAPTPNVDHPRIPPRTNGRRPAAVAAEPSRSQRAARSGTCIPRRESRPPLSALCAVHPITPTPVCVPASETPALATRITPLGRWNTLGRWNDTASSSSAEVSVAFKRS